MSYDRLPGGLGTWRARWLLARHNGILGPLTYLVALVVVLPVMLLWGALLALVGAGSARLGNRGGVPVTPKSHPELYDLVAATAQRLGTPMPGRVLLTATPTVDVTVAYRQRHLEIGLPLLACLSTAELRALVGHRLALLRHRHADLVTGLLDLWTDAVQAESYEEGRAQRRAAELRRTLAGFAAEAQRDADDAAVLAAGGVDPAARAFALASLVADEYAGFLDNSGVPEQRWWRPVEVGISDVDDGWRRALHHGLGESDWAADDAQLLATIHPRLAVALRALGHAPLSVTLTADPVPVPPLSERERRRVTRRIMDIPYPRYIRWSSFADSPPRWWLRRAIRDVTRVRSDVALVLGREPVDDVEVFQVVRTRPREVLAAALDVPVDELSDHPHDWELGDEPPDVLIWLVEENLLRRGWRLAHPAVRGVLVGPRGDRVDARDVIAQAGREAEDAPGLRRWLGPTAPTG
ncbi:M48 family metallopeptidase [Micromonospora sp. CA-263727]|uniref:M48 family metallopeptidase n=1 Tax=Micromonospora sp. CA-263727 TaxID=3239967 RepID=UPI003D8FFF48